MYDLENKVVLVTGASSGIGWCLALELAACDAQLILLARRQQRLEDLHHEIVVKHGGDPVVVVADVADANSVREGEKKIAEKFPDGVDVLINNAGRGLHSAFAEADSQQLSAIVETNLTGVIRCTQAVLPKMIARGDGCLVFISSVLGELPAPNNAVYGATKFAISGLAESLEYELTPRGISVLLVEPGLVPTEFAQVSGTPPGKYSRLPHTTPKQVARRIVAAIVQGQRRLIPDRFAKIGILWRRFSPRTWRIFYRNALKRVG